MDILLVAILLSSAIFAAALLLLLRTLAAIAPRKPLGRADRAALVWRLVRPVVRAIEPIAALTLTRGGERRVVERLARAGLSQALSASEFRSVQGCAVLICGAALAAIELAWLDRVDWLSIVVVAVVSFFWPDFWLHQRVRQRLARIRRQLPFLIDLVAMSVESGLPIGAALVQAVDRSPGGPLRDEFLRALGEIKAGRTRDESLTALSDRVGQPALTQFILALLAIQRDGGSVVHLLKTIAEQQRTDRLVRAEHQAMQAPVKLMLPLVLFIFPGTFAILLYPVVARVIAQGGLW